MALNTDIFFTKRIRARGSKFQLADGTNSKQIIAPGTEGTRVGVIVITTTFTSSNFAALKLNDLNQGLTFDQGHITIPANAGTNGSVAAVSGLNRGNLPWLEIDAFGNPYINLNYNMTLELKPNAAMSGALETNSLVLGGDYDA